MACFQKFVVHESNRLMDLKKSRSIRTEVVRERCCGCECFGMKTVDGTDRCWRKGKFQFALWNGKGRQPIF